MNTELYKQELWTNIDRTAVNLYYLDHFRDRQAKIEPLYRGALGMVATLAAIISFFDVALLIKTVSVITALLAALPLLFPVIPKSSDFEKMSQLRVATSKWLISLENFWHGEWTDEKYKNFSRMKLKYAETEDELSSLFGKINVALNRKAHDDANRYLDRYFTS